MHLINRLPAVLHIATWRPSSLAAGLVAGLPFAHAPRGALAAPGWTAGAAACIRRREERKGPLII